MSYTEADQPRCDGPCGRVYPPGWESCLVAPWPVTDDVMEADGRMTAAEAGNLHLCRSCLQALVISADLPRASRPLARRAAGRWAASAELLAACKAIDARTAAEAA